MSQAVLRAWVNGWFTTMWEVEGWDEQHGELALGRGGFHGGQPHMLDSVRADGSPGGPDEFLNATLNVTNRIDPGSMNQVMGRNLFGEWLH